MAVVVSGIVSLLSLRRRFALARFLRRELALLLVELARLGLLIQLRVTLDVTRDELVDDARRPLRVAGLEGDLDEIRAAERAHPQVARRLVDPIVQAGRHRNVVQPAVEETGKTDRQRERPPHTVRQLAERRRRLLGRALLPRG